MANLTRQERTPQSQRNRSTSNVPGPIRRSPSNGRAIKEGANSIAETTRLRYKNNHRLRKTLDVRPEDVVKKHKDLEGASIRRILSGPFSIGADVLDLLQNLPPRLQAAFRSTAPLPAEVLLKLVRRYQKELPEGVQEFLKEPIPTSVMGLPPNTLSLTQQLEALKIPIPFGGKTIPTWSFKHPFRFTETQIPEEAVVLPPHAETVWGKIINQAGTGLAFTAPAIKGAMKLAGTTTEKAVEGVKAGTKIVTAETAGVLAEEAITSEENEATLIPVFTNVVTALSVLGVIELGPHGLKVILSKLPSVENITEKMIAEQSESGKLIGELSKKSLALQNEIPGLTLTGRDISPGMQQAEKALRESDPKYNEQVRQAVEDNIAAINAKRDSLKTPTDPVDLQQSIQDDIDRIMAPLTQGAIPPTPISVGRSLEEAILISLKDTRDSVGKLLDVFSPLIIPLHRAKDRATLRRHAQKFPDSVKKSLLETRLGKEPSKAVLDNADLSTLSVGDLRRARTDVLEDIAQRKQSNIPDSREVRNLIEQSKTLDEMIDIIADAHKSVDIGGAEQLKILNGRYRVEVGDRFYRSGLATVVKAERTGVSNPDAAFQAFFGTGAIKPVKNIEDLMIAFGAEGFEQVEAFIQMGLAASINQVITTPKGRVGVQAIQQFMNQREEIVAKFPRLKSIYAEIEAAFGKGGKALDLIATKGVRATDGLIDAILDRPDEAQRLLRDIVPFLTADAGRATQFNNDLIDALARRAGATTGKTGTFGATTEPELGDFKVLGQVLNKAEDQLIQILGVDKFKGLSNVQQAMKMVAKTPRDVPPHAKVAGREFRKNVSRVAARAFALARRIIGIEFILAERSGILTAGIVEDLSDGQIRHLFKQFTGNPRFLQMLGKDLAEITDPVEAERVYARVIRDMARGSVDAVPMTRKELALFKRSKLGQRVGVGAAAVSQSLGGGEQFPPFIEDFERFRIEDKIGLGLPPLHIGQPFLMGDPTLQLNPVTPEIKSLPE